MKVVLESTPKVVELILNGQPVPARVWVGVTALGIECHAFITRIAVAKQDDAAEFERDLAAQRAPRPSDVPLLDAIPLRLVI